MCVIVVKEKNALFPDWSTLERCFKRNPDGAGFMISLSDRVVIEKGYFTFNDFKTALKKAKKKYGIDHTYVMHFRIETQGGIRAECCHPFPLSGNMDDLRKLETSCQCGVAHNGIISLTSTYLKKVSYSDTMLFITEYLNLILDSPNDLKDKKKMLLVERLCESKLAILFNNDQLKLLGSGWELFNGCYFSNKSYLEKATISPLSITYYEDYPDDDEYEEAYNVETDLYDFTPGDCPVSWYDDYLYCYECSSCSKCWKGGKSK